MDALLNEKYTTKRYKCEYSVHNSKVLRTCLACGNIFNFILTFRKNKYQIHSYTTSNMDDFKTIYEVHTISFQTFFFVQAFKIVVDS